MIGPLRRDEHEVELQEGERVVTEDEWRARQDTTGNLEEHVTHAVQLLLDLTDRLRAETDPVFSLYFARRRAEDALACHGTESDEYRHACLDVLAAAADLADALGGEA